MDDVIIYGNGAIEAYEAETKQAKYPRIILTKSANLFLEKSTKDLKINGVLIILYFTRL